MKILKVLLPAFFLLVACHASKEISEKEVQVRTVEKTLKIRDTVYMPDPTAVRTVVRTETLQVDRPVIVRDETGQATLSYWKNRANELEILCNNQPDPIIVRDSFEKIVYVDSSLTESSKETTKNRWGWAEWMMTGGGLVLLLAIAAFVYKRFRGPLSTLFNK